jgi:hypothetical protein
MARASRLVADGVAPHLGGVGFAEADYLALELWQRACANDKKGVARILNPLLGDPDPTFYSKVQAAMLRIESKACRQAALASLAGADSPPQPPAVVTDEDRNLDPHTPSNPSWPLVAERTVRRDPLPELARDENRERQSRYCQGFDPDWWLPALLAAKWRTPWYPREATHESVQQWSTMIDQMRVEYLGPFGMPDRAAEMEGHRDSDLALIRQHAPHLYKTGPETPATPGDKSRPGTVATEHPVASPSGSRPALKKPSKAAMMVYRYWLGSNLLLSERKTQKELADDPALMELLGRKIDQGTVSRSIKRVEEWIEAGNVLPDLSEPLDSKPSAMDPSQIDLGARQDGRGKRQRGRRNSDRDD